MIATKYTGVHYRDMADGRRMFYVSYKGADGKLVRKKIGTKDEGINAAYCKRLRDESLLKQRLGEDAPVKKRSTIITLDAVADEYFGQLTAKSTQKLKSVYNTHILKKIAHEPIHDIDKKMIESLKASKAKEKSAKTGRVLSHKTVNNILSILSAILHYAKEEEYIKGVPTIKKFTEDNKRERFLSKDEINTLYEKIKNSDLRTKDRVLLFTKLSLMTGGRLGSILSIHGKDIDRTNKTLMLHNHKTGKDYTAFLTDELLEQIPVLKPQERLIGVADAKQIQRPLQGILDRLFNKGLKAEDRKHRVVIHSLRHTYASHLAINGTPVATIMKLMDHSDIKMTLRYAKLMPDSGRTEVEGLYQ